MTAMENQILPSGEHLSVNGGYRKARTQVLSPFSSAQARINPFREITPETERLMSPSGDQKQANGLSFAAKTFLIIHSRLERAAMFPRRAITTATDALTRLFSA